MLTNYQKAAALHINTALGCVSCMLELAPPKSAEFNRLRGAEAALNRCLDTYRLEKFPLEDAQKASALIDLVNDKINELYPSEG